MSAAEAALEIPDISLGFVAGKTVARLGATGAGKSTITKLIARFYDPLERQILLYGIDLRNPADRDLRSAVTLLTQEGFLFAGSVEDNIRVRRPSATRTEVEAAARAMAADAFIRALPDGYDADIRKPGTRLSAEQRQMIAFARAFLADPAVLILDEAISALDIPTERAMQAALGKLLSGRTALIIAHRLSTVEIADRVLVIADGRVVDDGTPAGLLAKGTGELATLYRDAQGCRSMPRVRIEKRPKSFTSGAEQSEGCKMAVARALASRQLFQTWLGWRPLLYHMDGAVPF